MEELLSRDHVNLPRSTVSSMGCYSKSPHTRKALESSLCGATSRSRHGRVRARGVQFISPSKVKGRKWTSRSPYKPSPVKVAKRASSSPAKAAKRASDKDNGLGGDSSGESSDCDVATARQHLTFLLPLNTDPMPGLTIAPPAPGMAIADLTTPTATPTTTTVSMGGPVNVPTISDSTPEVADKTRELVYSGARIESRPFWQPQNLSSTCARLLPLGELRLRRNARCGGRNGALSGAPQLVEGVSPMGCEEVSTAGGREQDFIGRGRVVKSDDDEAVSGSYGERYLKTVIVGMKQSLMKSPAAVLLDPVKRRRNLPPSVLHPPPPRCVSQSSHVTFQTGRPLESNIGNAGHATTSQINDCAAVLQRGVAPNLSSHTPPSDLVSLGCGSTLDAGDKTYPDLSQLVGGSGNHGYTEDQLRQHAEGCSCPLCSAELALLCLQAHSHDIEHCFCNRCAWGIGHFFHTSHGT